MRGHISTAWDVTDKAKRTRFVLADGSVVILDHQAVAAHLSVEELITESFTTDRNVGRLQSHYDNLFKAWFIDGTPPLTAEQDHKIHRLLLS